MPFSWKEGGFLHPVSEAFLQAVQENTREYRWTGRITTAKGRVYEFGPEDIVKGRGYITRSCCGSTKNRPLLTMEDMRRIVAVYRFILPEASIRLAVP